MAPVAVIVGLAVGLGFFLVCCTVVVYLYLNKKKYFSSSHRRSTSTSGEKGMSSLSSSFKVLSFKKLANKHSRGESGETDQVGGGLGTSASYKELLSAGLMIRLYAQSEIANGVAYIAGTPHSIWDLIQAGVDFNRRVVPISDSKGQEIAILIQGESCEAFFATGADVLGDDAMQDIWAPLFHFAGQMKSALGKRTSANVELGANLSKLIGSDTNVLPNSVTSAWIRAGLGTQDRLVALVPVMQNVVDRAIENAIGLSEEPDHDQSDGDKTDIVETMEALTLALVIRCIFGDDVYAKEGGNIAHLLRTIRNILCDSINLQNKNSLEELSTYYRSWFQLVEQIILDSILTAEALGRTMKGDQVGKPMEYLGWLTTTLRKNGAPSSYFSCLPVHLLVLSLQIHIYLHNILSWMMIDIVGNANALKEARKQASDAVSVTHPTSPFLDRCLRESYRLHSPALVTRRKTNSEVTHLGSTLIASNILVAASPYVQNSDPMVFDDPESYQPSRWTNQHPSRPTSPSPVHLRTPRSGQAAGHNGTSTESLLTPSIKEPARPSLSRLRGPIDTFIDFALNVVSTAIFAQFHLRPRSTVDGTPLGQVDQVFASERGLWCAWPQTNAYLTVERAGEFASQSRSMSAQSLSNRNSANLQTFKQLISTPVTPHGIEINIKRATVLEPVAESAESDFTDDDSSRGYGVPVEVDALTAVESVATLARRTTASSPMRSDYSTSSRTERESLHSGSPEIYRQYISNSQITLGQTSETHASTLYLTPSPNTDRDSRCSNTSSIRSFDDDFAELERQLLTPLSRSGSTSSVPPPSPSHSMLSAASSPPMTPISGQRHSQVTDSYQWESQLARMGVPYIREESSSTLDSYPSDGEDLTERGIVTADGLLRVGGHNDQRESIGASSLYTQSSLPRSSISRQSQYENQDGKDQVVYGLALSGSDQGADRSITPTADGLHAQDTDRARSPSPSVSTIKSTQRRPLPQVPQSRPSDENNLLSKPRDPARLSMISQYSEGTRFADAKEDDLAVLPPRWQMAQAVVGNPRSKRHPNILKIQSVPQIQARTAGQRMVLADVTNTKQFQHAMPLPIIVRSATNESLRRDFTWVGDAIGVRESNYRFSKFYNRA